MTYRSFADLGGAPGHGPVVPEPEGALWHATFEPKALALTLAMGATGAWNIDQSRAARETLPGYADLSYYRIWLAALERLLAERAGPARFAVGDRVRTRAGQVDHHSRLPGYVQGKVGTVVAVHGAHVFADAHAQGLGEQPQWLYTVAFDGAVLWGADGEPGLQVSVDAWESGLQPADGAAA